MSFWFENTPATEGGSRARMVTLRLTPWKSPPPYAPSDPVFVVPVWAVLVSRITDIGWTLCW